MATLLAAAYWLLTLALAPCFAFLGLVAAAALAPRRRRAAARDEVSPPPRFLFVIPAHDEEANVGATVASCKAVDYDPGRFTVLVIADNCNDGTAVAARAAGAVVVERTDPGRRSKGYALDDVLQGLADSGELARYDAAILVDADTEVDPGLPRAFAASLAEGADWAQGYYSVKNPDASWRTRLLTCALGLFNGAWLLGQDRLGLGANFRGNGMCLSTRGLARHPWRAHGLVEDQEFGWSLRLAGERVRFVPGARVYAEMVCRGRDAASQRHRWEAGRRSLRPRFARPLLASRRIGPGRKLLAAADLFFPPLVPLFLALSAALTVHALAPFDPGLLPAARALRPWHAAMLLAAVAYAASPFLTLGLSLRYATSLWAAPYYAVWKFFATFRVRTTAWVRTPREAAPARRAEAELIP
jgi:cellulose synthase/poly-beta-1,6-N-acetylglucosamine synthase-like glycosyltransferase